MASGRRDAMRAMPHIPLPYTPTHRTLSRPHIIPRILPPAPVAFLRGNEAAPSRISPAIECWLENIDGTFHPVSAAGDLYLRLPFCVFDVGEDAFSIAIRSGILVKYISKPRLSTNATQVPSILIGADRARNIEEMRRRMVISTRRVWYSY